MYAASFWTVGTLVLIIMAISVGYYVGSPQDQAGGISAITVGTIVSAAGVALMGYIAYRELGQRI